MNRRTEVEIHREDLSKVRYAVVVRGIAEPSDDGQAARFSVDELLD
jgi:hypothetical protein